MEKIDRSKLKDQFKEIGINLPISWVNVLTPYEIAAFGITEAKFHIKENFTGKYIDVTERLVYGVSNKYLIFRSGDPSGSNFRIELIAHEHSSPLLRVFDKDGNQIGWIVYVDLNFNLNE